jgi:hypothetical protein
MNEPTEMQIPQPSLELFEKQYEEYSVPLPKDAVFNVFQDLAKEITALREKYRIPDLVVIGAVNQIGDNGGVNKQTSFQHSFGHEGVNAQLVSQFNEWWKQEKNKRRKTK